MQTLWFSLVAVMLAGYVMLDGFDLGAGVIHLFVARNDMERREVLASIGPVWDGNEVWLLGAGGVLFFAFPGLYASGFSGFYLALMIVLWLLILRGISIELRSHFAHELWCTFWDFVFAASSLLLAVFYGAAIGNVIRGVPLDADGFFFLPLWTDLRAVGMVGIIDWYTVFVGISALGVLTMHGALWVALKTSGDVHLRSIAVVRRLWLALLPIVFLMSWMSFQVQPHLADSFRARPWGAVFPLLAGGSFFAVRWFLKRVREAGAFVSSCIFIAGMLSSAAFGLYPNVLPSSIDGKLNLTVDNAAAAEHGLRVGVFWFVPAFLLVIAYTVFVHRHFSGKVDLSGQQH